MWMKPSTYMKRSILSITVKTYRASGEVGLNMGCTHMAQASGHACRCAGPFACYRVIPKEHTWCMVSRLSVRYPGVRCKCSNNWLAEYSRLSDFTVNKLSTSWIESASSALENLPHASMIGDSV